MKIKESIFKKIFPSKVVAKFILKDGHQMELCFTSGNVKYFAFSNDFKIPIERVHAAQEIYDELEWKVDKTYLEGHIESIRIACNKGNLQKVFEIASMLEERMKNVHNIGMLYKLASVYFIAEDENAYEYDMEFNKAKIAHWIENKTFDAFFLSVHMKDLAPYFEAYTDSFLTYFKGESLELKGQLSYLLSTMQSENTESGLPSKIRTQIQELEELVEKI